MYHHEGCTWIYLPLSYPMRFMFSTSFFEDSCIFRPRTNNLIKMGDNHIEEEDRKLFVGGLAQECSQDDLKVRNIYLIITT